MKAIQALFDTIAFVSLMIITAGIVMVLYGG